MVSTVSSPRLEIQNRLLVGMHGHNWNPGHRRCRHSTYLESPVYSSQSHLRPHRSREMYRSTQNPINISQHPSYMRRDHVAVTTACYLDVEDDVEEEIRRFVRLQSRCAVRLCPL